MRISLLLQREPFGDILEQTLAAFLGAWAGQPHQVHWYDRRPNPGAMRRQGQQPWLCNIYLNAIFAPGTRPEVFDPVRREFGRSVVRWRRPAQRAYVDMAMSPLGARWLAQAGVGISPPLPDAGRLLIVPGNHKIRVLDRDNGLVYNVVKQGFPAHFMQRELAARRQAQALGLPVPALKTVAPDQTWFSEQYVVGTPLNRLADPRVAEKAKQTAMNALARLLEHTSEQVSLDDYVEGLQTRIQDFINDNHLLSDAQKRTLVENAATLTEHVLCLSSAVDGQITTALTHGDFQPGNILADGNQVWLIDWEYSGRRQMGYDALVYGLRSRFPDGLAARLKRMLDGTDAVETLSPFLPHCPGLEWRDVPRRRVYGLLFMLEDLVLYLEENMNSRFYCLGTALVVLQTQIADILTYM